MLVKCDFCGAEFERKPGQVKARNYCSRKCLGRANAERYRKQRLMTCDNCGRVFEYRGHHKHRNSNFFCSEECYLDFKTKKVEVECDLCGNLFLKKRSDVWRSKHNFCCEKCYKDFIALSKQRKDGPAYSGKMLYRLIIEKKIGRKLEPGEHVHHIDGDHNNNAPSNLLLVSQSDHMKIHAAKKKRDSNGRFIRGEE